MRLPALILVAALHSLAAMAAESVPEAVIADPPTDAKFPARMEVVHVPSGGVQINDISAGDFGAIGVRAQQDREGGDCGDERQQRSPRRCDGRVHGG